MLSTIYAIKTNQTQKYTSAGKRIPVTVVKILSNTVTQIKTKDKDGYSAVQIMLGYKKSLSKPLSGNLKSIQTLKGLQSPRFIREIKLGLEESTFKRGEEIKSTSFLKPGDSVNVSAVSKGKGFAGVVKRHHFAGGPRTHGQSDRERAPGSIGQTTTPGRVYKGKRMAGHMGGVKRTQRNLIVLSVSDTQIELKGTIPGPLKSLAKITRVGEAKHFQPLLSTKGLDKEAIAVEQSQAESQAEGSDGTTQAQTTQTGSSQTDPETPSK